MRQNLISFPKQFTIIFLSLPFLLFSSCKSENSIPVAPVQTGKTVVEYYGTIRAKGNKIVDKSDNPVSLHGMSLFWSQWGGNFYNASCVQWLRDDWMCTVVRAACGVESGGYLTNPQVELNKITTVIDACINLGIYVVVDWHDHHAEDHLAQSKEFFKIIAQKYGNKPNIIYEIYNEPLQVSWINVLKPYAQEVIKVIRQFDTTNLIVVGTPNWSQDVDDASKSPIQDVNVAYSLHFYSGTHKQSYRDKAVVALNSGVALFVNEFGICESSGNGAIDYAETQKWLTFVDTYKISTCNWSCNDKVETVSALVLGASPLGNWKTSDLTPSGTYIRDRLRYINAQVFNGLTK